MINKKKIGNMREHKEAQNGNEQSRETVIPFLFFFGGGRVIR